MDTTTIARTLGGHHSGPVSICRCPCCGYKGGFSISQKDGRTLVHCHIGCEQADVLNALRQQGLWGGGVEAPWEPANPAKAAKTQRADNGHMARNLWRKAQPATGTLVEVYLRARCIVTPPPPVLRFHPAALHEPTATLLPCMVAAVTVGMGARVVAIHRTFLQPDGSGKATVDPAKMTLGPIAGGAIRLAAPAAEMGMAEGIETAMSAAALSGLPVWACMTAGGVRQVVLPPLPLAKRVVIFADNDRNRCGQAAAYAAADRFAIEGRTVKVIVPPKPATDFNDMLMERA